MSNFAKFLPTIIPILVLIASTFAPQVQAFISGHPSAALALGGIYSILSHLLPSPLLQSCSRHPFGATWTTRRFPGGAAVDEASTRFRTWAHLTSTDRTYHHAP